MNKTIQSCEGKGLHIKEGNEYKWLGPGHLQTGKQKEMFFYLCRIVYLEVGGKAQALHIEGPRLQVL